MKVSVLICTNNRAALLDQAIRSLIKTTTERPDEIIVVVGGEDESEQVLEKWRRQFQELKWTKIRNIMLANSRNVGLPLCSGDIIAMTDDDAEVFPDWVTQMKHAHREHPEAGAVGGLVLGTNRNSLVGAVADLITFPSWSEARYVRTLPGVNISYKREVVEQTGPQDETLFRGEDVDYNYRVLMGGYQIYFDPKIKVYHHHRPTLRSFLSQHYMYGRAYYLVRRKWPEMYCIYPHGFHRPKDFLKAVNFIAALFYQPVLTALKIPSLGHKLASLPGLFLAGVVWKSGMLKQALKELRSKDSLRKLPKDKNPDSACSQPC